MRAASEPVAGSARSLKKEGRGRPKSPVSTQAPARRPMRIGATAPAVVRAGRGDLALKSALRTAAGSAGFRVPARYGRRLEVRREGPLISDTGEEKDLATRLVGPKGRTRWPAGGAGERDHRSCR